MAKAKEEPVWVVIQQTSYIRGMPCSICTKNTKNGQVVLYVAYKAGFSVLQHKECIERILESAPPSPVEVLSEFEIRRQNIIESKNIFLEAANG